MSQAEPQILTLTVTGNQAGQLGSRSRKMFAGKDGSIGRAEDCDWVLAATGVSRVHAMIRYVNGLYFVEDRSTNGMLLNDSPLLKGDPAALKNGDHLRIDKFDISVTLQQDSETIVQVAPAGAATEAGLPPAAPPSAPPAPVPAAAIDELLDFGVGAPAPAGGGGSESLIPDAPSADSGNLDPLSLFDAPSAPMPTAAPTPSAGWDHSSGVEDHFRPPSTNVQRESGVLPDDWDAAPAPPEPVARPPAQVAPPPPPPAPAPAPAPVAPTAPAPAVAPPPEMDAMLRIVIDGVMDVLRARAEIKNTFRLPVTVIQRRENNPLKFALGVDDALKKILAAPDPAFLTGATAFEDAFDDIRCHQMAMLAGVRAGFDALLRHFEPHRYASDADAGAPDGFVGKMAGKVSGGKGRYWDRYCGDYQSLVADPDACFRRLFGEEFARAYEEQLARLKTARRAQRSRSGTS